MGQMIEYIKMALSNIRSNKGRSFLTMLGIIIGISSVITIMGVGNGFEEEMNEQLASFAGGQIYIYTSDEGQRNDEYMNAEDMEAIEALEGVSGTSPDYMDTGITLAPKGTFDVSIRGGGTAQEEVSGIKIIAGRYYNEGDIATGNHVCVIRKKDALKAFGTDDILGMSLEVSLYNNTVDLTIIGIFENKNEDSMVSYDYAGDSISLEMPYTAFEAFGWETTEDIYSFYVTTDGTVESAIVAQSAIQLMNRRHYSQGEDYYQMQDYNDQVGQVNSMLGMITGFISFVAGISLLVGGIGVMNIMLVSVTERTREIGLKKALGAKKSKILVQFLTEAAVLTLMGGILGIIVGIILAYVISGISSAPVAISGPAIALAVAFSTVIGVVFGMVPSVKAANMNPIDALRHE